MASGASAQIAEPVESVAQIAEPVEKNKTCDTYGNKFFNLPVIGTCLNISGEVRAESFAVDIAGAPERNVTSRVIADLRFDARNETDFGQLQTYLAWRFIRIAGRDQTIKVVDRAFISLGGFQLSYAPTFFTENHDNGWQKSNFLAYFSLDRATILQYTYSGNGFSTTIGIQDTLFIDTEFPDEIDEIVPSDVNPADAIDPFAGGHYKWDRVRLAGTIIYDRAASALAWKTSVELDASDNISLKTWFSGDTGSAKYVTGDGSLGVEWEWGADVVYKINGDLSLWAGYTDADFVDAERVGIGARWNPVWKLSVRPEAVFGPDYTQVRLRITHPF